MQALPSLARNVVTRAPAIIAGAKAIVLVAASADLRRRIRGAAHGKNSL